MPTFLCFRLMLTCMLLAASCVVAAQPQPQAITRVYRADTRSPIDLFHDGMTGRGTRADLLAHTVGGSCNQEDPARASWWVSTSVSEREAYQFAMTQLNVMVEAGNPNAYMWVYEIRPDSTYFEVEGVVNQAIDASERSLEGFTPDDAITLRRMLNTGVMGTEQEVVVHYVDPRNIVSATPYHYIDDELANTLPVNNAHYVAMNTQASRRVAHLRDVITPEATRVSYDPDSSSCSMTCDGSNSTSGSSRSAAKSETAMCKLERKKQLTRQLLQIILD